MSTAELLAAASVGNLALLQQLLGDGADPGAASAASYTALHAAAMGGHLHIIQLLVERGVAVDAANAGVRTPLV